MTQLEILYQIVRPALADSLGKTKKEEGDIWTNHTLRGLGADEPFDLPDIAWRLERRVFETLKLRVSIDVKELEDEPGRQAKTVADVVLLIGQKLDASDVPATLVVTV